MSRSSNSILAGDISVTPIKLKYSASFTGSQFPDANIINYDGINGGVTSTGSISQTTLNYRSIRHLYYSNYLTGSFPVTASSYDNFLQSTAASGTLDADVRYFPTAAYATIKIISIPREVFGERISRRSFKLTSSLADLVDDGNGNIINRVSKEPVGNLIYAQGMAIITNQNYINTISVDPGNDIPTYKLSLVAETTIYQNEINCRVLENDFNYSQNPTMRNPLIPGYFYVPGGTGNATFIDIPAGTLANNVSGSDFKPYATTVGLYSAANELLVVGKLATPYAIPSNTDITFVIRYDS